MRLAILGGRPHFPRPLHVGAPNIGDRERLLQRIGTILDTRRLSNFGPNVRLFEDMVAARAQVKHCVAMCNGTVALEIGARALGLAGEVIVPAFTFVATAHALAWQGIRPVFCDIDPVTHLIDPQKAEALITPRTTGILAVHLWGRPAPVDALQEIADRHGIRLMFDAAHAFGCSHGQRMVGGFGDLEVFSFHATKFLNSAEGGAIVTNDDELARRARLMSNFGFTGLDRVEALGVNGKMNELSAAVGLNSFESMEEWLAVNRRNMDAWREALAPCGAFPCRRRTGATVTITSMWSAKSRRSRRGWTGTSWWRRCGRRTCWRDATSTPDAIVWNPIAPTRPPAAGICPAPSESDGA